ncbi:protein unc-50 [Polychytrium aggregatum]|uniref:protein unc-50 n=1 Tax=Polychytrium aggregatum TaxID=110093 RepID=UPI0022FDC4D5|nr:protein unc-50 [Polychytrium aggregatum]KAI9208536.1 protein unc-50 [Polychytrium aggregatum]
MLPTITTRDTSGRAHSFLGSPSSPAYNRAHRRPRSLSSVPTYLRRLVNFSQMDFEFALWQMLYLCISPQRLYRNIYYHKQTKNQWARDDPAFVVLIAACLSVTAIAYGIAYKLGALGIIGALLFMIFIDFLLVGVVVATAVWFFANRYLIQHHTHSVEQSVEWAYAFDVHCNSFFPMFLVTYVFQFFFLAIVTKDTWVGRILGNTLYLLGTSYYVYITFLGYKALPFLKNTTVFLYPIGVIVILYVISLLGFNVSKVILDLYF